MAAADDVASLQQKVKALTGNLRTCMKAANVGTPDFVAGKPHYAFLVLREHPYGREMLEQLLAKGSTQGRTQCTAPPCTFTAVHC